MKEVQKLFYFVDRQKTIGFLYGLMASRPQTGIVRRRLYKWQEMAEVSKN